MVSMAAVSVTAVGAHGGWGHRGGWGGGGWGGAGIGLAAGALIGAAIAAPAYGYGYAPAYGYGYAPAYGYGYDDDSPAYAPAAYDYGYAPAYGYGYAPAYSLSHLVTGIGLATVYLGRIWRVPRSRCRRWRGPWWLWRGFRGGYVRAGYGGAEQPRWSPHGAPLIFCARTRPVANPSDRSPCSTL